MALAGKVRVSEYSIAKIPYPLVDKPGGRSAQVGEGHGLPLAIVGIGGEMGYRRRVYGYRKRSIAYATGCIGDGKHYGIDPGCQVGMRSVAAECRGSVAEIPEVGSGGSNIDQRAVGQELRRAVSGSRG